MQTEFAREVQAELARYKVTGISFYFLPASQRDALTSNVKAFAYLHRPSDVITLNAKHLSYLKTQSILLTCITT